MNVSKEMLKGYIDIILISVLKIKDMYGYELCKIIRKKSNNDFEIKEATIYLALKRLEKNNLIESYWNDKKNNDRKRKYYHITNNGFEYFNNKKVEWNFIRNLIDKFLEVK